ncbi:hypothetical protein VAWG005_07820 [Aeromonas dhakensis]|nr:hypothetical protein VAWG003_07780 [Aeromonas dhakensis]BEE24854.1 hypothetical protein VAWG005_07820 [Aeromonas dhakensis]
MAVFVPLTFAAGEAYQFDWGEEEVELGGVVQRVKAAHFRPTHSRQPFVMVFPREPQEMAGMCRAPLPSPVPMSKRRTPAVAPSRRKEASSAEAGRVGSSQSLIA